MNRTTLFQRNISKLEFVMPGEIFPCILNSCKGKRTTHIINVDAIAYMSLYPQRQGLQPVFNLSRFKNLVRY